MREHVWVGNPLQRLEEGCVECAGVKSDIQVSGLGELDPMHDTVKVRHYLRAQSKEVLCWSPGPWHYRKMLHP